MNKNNNTELAKDMGLAIVFSISYIMLSARLSLYFLLLIPIPFVIASVRNKNIAGPAAFIISCLVLGLIYEPTTGLSIMGIFLPIIFALGHMINKNYDSKRIIAVASLVFLASLVLVLSLETNISGINFKNELELAFNNMLEMQTEAFKNLDMTKMEIERGRSFLSSSYSFMLAIMPSLFILFSLVIGYVNYKLSAYILNKTGQGYRKLPDFSRFRLPENIITGSLIMLLAAFIIGRMELPYHRALNMNLSFLLGLAFLIQGFSLIDYFLKKLGVRKAFRLIILILNIIFMPLAGLLVILGLVDAIFDLRKLKKRS